MTDGFVITRKEHHCIHYKHKGDTLIKKGEQAMSSSYGHFCKKCLLADGVPANSWRKKKK